MASTDALPVPRKNTAYRVTFDLRKNDGSLITGATGLDSEVSKDGAALADCTSEATEIGGGLYYLDLTATEMNADTVSVIVKSSTSGALTVALVLYPQESGDILVTVQSILSDVITAASIAANAITSGKFASGALDAVWERATSALTTAGSIGKLLVDNINATIGSRSTLTAANVWDYLVSSLGATSTVGGYVKSIVDAIKAKTDSLTFTGGDVHATLDGELVTVATNNDKTGYALTGDYDAAKTAAQAGNAMTLVDGAITASKIASNAIDADALAADAVTEIQSGLSTLNAAGVRSALGLASGNLDTQLGDIPTNTELGDALEALQTYGDTEWATATGFATVNPNNAGIASILAIIQKIDGMLQLDGALYQFTVNALENAPTGGSAPSAEENAQAIVAQILTGSEPSNTVGGKLNAAGSAGDPLINDVPGSYDEGTAGWYLGQLDAIRAATSHLDSGTVVVRAPVDARGNITIGVGKDYTGDDRLHFHSGSARDLLAEGVSVKLDFGGYHFAADEIVGAPSGWEFRIPVPAASTRTMSPTTYDGELAVYVNDVEKPEIATVKVIVERNP